MPQVKSSNKSKKDSSSSSNNNHAKSNVVASSSSLDSTNDSLSQVTLEQENSLLKGIIEKGVYRVLSEVSNSRKLYASKEGTGRTKVLVLNESSMPMELSGKKINTPRKSLFLNKRSMILLPSREHKHKMIFHHRTTRTKARTSFKKRLMHLKKHLKPRSVGSPRLRQVLPHQVQLQLQGFSSRWCASRRRRTREFLRVTPPTYFTLIILARTSAINFHILH